MSATRKKTGKSKAGKSKISKNRRKSRPARAKGRISLPWSLLILITSGILGYTFTSNLDIWDSITQMADSAWDTVSNTFPDADSHPIVPSDNEVIVHFIDVGQGDSVLIQSTQGNVLIDGGDNHMGGHVSDYLHRAGVAELTYVIATHPHADHIGGLIEVLNQFPVGRLIMPPVAHTTVTFERFLDAIESNGVPLKEPIAGSGFSVGDAHFTIIAPNSTGHTDFNDYSVSLHMNFGATSFIFTGDSEAAAELEMLSAGHNLSSDVLHVGHHGSTTSTAQEFLDAVNPSIAVISVGADNSYGHPHNAVMSRMRVAGIKIYRTDHHGNIVIVSDGANLIVYHD